METSPTTPFIGGSTGPTAAQPVEQFQEDGGAAIVPPSMEHQGPGEINKNLTSEPEKFNAPLNFSDTDPALQAIPSEKMEYEARDRGPKTKFYERTALLEMMYAGDTRAWDKLEPQMQRYYRREYPEYFGRDSKAKQEKRQENKVKAARIRHERLQREVRGAATVLSDY